MSAMKPHFSTPPGGSASSSSVVKIACAKARARSACLRGPRADGRRSWPSSRSYWSEHFDRVLSSLWTAREFQPPRATDGGTCLAGTLLEAG